MAGGGPGGNSRGRGGKFRKFTRGGGKHFSRDLRPLDADGNEISMWGQDPKNSQGGSDDDDDDDSESEEEDSDDEVGPSKAGPGQDLSREERKKEKKIRKEAAIARAKKAAIQVGDLPPSDSDDGSSESDDDMPANPNHSKAARKQAIAPVKKPDDDDVGETAAGVSKMAISQKPQSRKERESAEAALAKERYMKAHLAGKTDEAKADLARLAEIRAKREADRARRAAEEEERKEQEAAKRAEIEAKEAKKREAALGKPASKKGGKKK